MNVDFTAAITDLEGTPITEITRKDKLVAGVPTPSFAENIVTLGMLAGNALTGTYQDEPGLSGADKVKRFQLAEKTISKLPVDLDAESISLIKTLIGKAYNPLFVGRAYNLIDPPKPAG